MDREIWWIRHGESEWNREGRWQGHSDPPLSELGREQARRLARRLRGRGFDQVYTSDLVRTRTTAELALPEARADADARLREIHFGEFEGSTAAELTTTMREQWEAWWRDPFGLRAPGGESMTDLAERVEAWLKELPEEGKFAVVTHGGVIRCMLWQITGAPPEGRWTVTLDNTSITRIRTTPQRTRIICVNDASHLEDE